MVKTFFGMALLILPATACACSVCFGSGNVQLGLILAGALLLPLPILITWGLIKAAKDAEKESQD